MLVVVVLCSCYRSYKGTGEVSKVWGLTGFFQVCKGRRVGDDYETQVRERNLCSFKFVLVVSG